MCQIMWTIGASWNSVKVKCKSDVQREAPKQSSDLKLTAIKTQLTRRGYPKQNQIERQWDHVETLRKLTFSLALLLLFLTWICTFILPAWLSTRYN